MEKEINVYDLNMPSAFRLVYNIAENEGIKVNRIDNLSSAKKSLLTIIVPTGPVNTNWSKIKNYINENPATKIFILDLSTRESELKNLIGKDKNVEYLITQETRMEFTYDKLLNKLGVTN